MKLILFELFGTDSVTGILARAVVSSVVGWLLAFNIVGRYSTVTERHV